MLKAIIFNIDGVITNLSCFNFLAWKSIFSFQGIDLNREKWSKYVHKSRLDIASSVLRDHHKSLNAEKIKEIGNQKNELFIHLIKNKLTSKNIYNGITTLIEKSKARGLQLIVISNSLNAPLEIKCLGLSKKFNKIFNLSNAFYNGKNMDTDEQLLKLLSKCNLKPDECIGLEDNLDNIKRYKRLGIFTIGITNFDEKIKKDSDYWVDLPEKINFDAIIFAYYKYDHLEI